MADHDRKVPRRIQEPDTTMSAAPPEDVRHALDRLFRGGAAGCAPDGELLTRFLEGPEARAADAFAALLDRHAPAVLRACRRVLDDPHDAEDVAQAAFLVLARRARSVRRRDSVSSFLVGTALRLARRLRVDRARRLKHERRGAVMSVRSDSRRETAESWPTLYEELDRLPESLRTPLILCYLEGLTNEQAAGRLRLPLRTVQRRLAEGRERLRLRLVRRGVAPALALLTAASAESLAAAVPAAWIDATARAAAQLISGRSAAGPATAPALTLAEEALNAMFRAKLRIAAAALIGLVAFSAALLPLALGQKPAAPPPDEPAAVPDEPQPRPLGHLPDWVNKRPTTGPGRTFHLQVVDAATGQPIPFATVHRLVLGGNDWRTADAEGRLDILHSTGPSDTELTIDVWGAGHAAQRHAWGQRGEPIPDEATIRLQPGTTLGGMVTDEQGRPVGGATVHLWGRSYKKRDPHEALYGLPATTGPDGRWRITTAPEPTGELTGFRITHPDYISDPTWNGDRDRPTLASLLDGTAVSVLKKGTPIVGRVLDPDGRPVADALVFATDDPSTSFAYLAPFAQVTDAVGRFRLPQAKPGPWFVFARAPEHGPAVALANVGTAIPQAELRLTRPARVGVRVVDPDGRPIAGASVQPIWKRYRCLGLYLWTDADGRADWDGPPDDPWLVSAYTRGYLDTSQEGIVPSDEAAVLTLTPALTISGTVLDAETGRRIKTARLEFGTVAPGTDEVASWLDRSRAYFHALVDEGALSAELPLEPGVDSYKLRIVAQGYAPFITRAFRREEHAVHDYEVKLQPNPATAPDPDEAQATALDPEGKPLAGARVLSSGTSDNLNLTNGEPLAPEAVGQPVRTAENGTFPFVPRETRGLVLVLGDRSWGITSHARLTESRTVKTGPYARVEGRLLVAGKPQAQQQVRLSGGKQGEPDDRWVLFYSQTTTTDAEGRFTFEKVIPMLGLRVAPQEPESSDRVFSTNGKGVLFEPDATARVVLGDEGRPVIGRAEAPPGWDDPVDFTHAVATLETHRATSPFPPDLFRGKTDLEKSGASDWSHAWHAGPEGRAADAARVSTVVGLAPDGSFRFDDVPPGRYHVVVQFRRAQTNPVPFPFEPRMRVFEVPPIPGGRTAEPLDLGRLILRERTPLEVGQPAPHVEVTTVSGERLRVPGDFAGKFLLIEFATTESDQSRLDIVRYNDVHARFGDDPRFTLLTLTLDDDTPTTRAYIAAKGEPWPQAIVGSPSNPIVSAYNSIHPAASFGVLIDPDGKVVAKDLRYPAIGEAVAKALGREP